MLVEYGQAEPGMPLLRGITTGGGLMAAPESGINLTGPAKAV